MGSTVAQSLRYFATVFDVQLFLLSCYKEIYKCKLVNPLPPVDPYAFINLQRSMWTILKSPVLDNAFKI